MTATRTRGGGRSATRLDLLREFRSRTMRVLDAIRDGEAEQAERLLAALADELEGAIKRSQAGRVTCPCCLDLIGEAELGRHLRDDHGEPVPV
jgi:hypothetical protein